MGEVAAIVLAGGPRDAVAALEPGAPNKAFVKILGTPLLARVLAGLRASARIGTIVIVAPESARHRPERAGALFRRDGRRISDSLAAGLAGLPPDRLALVVPSDLPLLSAAGIDEFLHAAMARECEIAYACLERSVHEARFPGVPHTWAKLSEGSFCGGGLIAIKPRAFDSLGRFLERLGAARKQPAKLAALMGRDVIVSYLRGRLSIADCEARAAKLLGFAACAVVVTHPEIAVNIDRPSDVALAERLLDR